MSIGPLGIVPLVSGTPSAQSKGSEVQRAAHDLARQQRQVEAGRRAEAAAGIGAAEGDENGPSDRDADGRRTWETPPGKLQGADRSSGASEPRRAGDASGQSGTQLDLAG